MSKIGEVDLGLGSLTRQADLRITKVDNHGGSSIELTRPRSSEIVSSDAFGRYVAQIWGDLREEASRGMRDDEKNRGGRP